MLLLVALTEPARTLLEVDQVLLYVENRELGELWPSLRLSVICEETQGELHDFNVAGRVVGGLKANQVAPDGLPEQKFCYKDVIRNQLCRRTGPGIHS